VMIVGGEDSSKGLFVTEEESPYEEPKIGTELLNETSQILYVAPQTIQDSPMKAQVIASAWELMWWKKGETGGANKVTPEIQSIQDQGKETASGLKLRPLGVPQNRKGRALEAVMKAMSSWCPVSQVVVENKQVNLVILDVLPHAELDSISSAPQMPTISVKAQLQNFDKGEVTFNWLFVTKWVSREPRTFHTIFEGTTTAQNSEESTWPVSWNQMTRGGDDISVFVVAIAANESYDTKKENLPKIIGTNPSVDQVREGLTIEEQVLVFMESNPKWKHFDDKGFPIFGKPHGYGLMQIDNPRATDEQVWNWRENKAAGKALFAEKRSDAKSYSSRIDKGSTWYWIDQKNKVRGYNDPLKGHWEWYPRPYLNAKTLTDGEQMLKEAFQRYNGGVYWRWKLKNPEDEDNANATGGWVKVTTGNYGDKAWEIYDGIKNDNTYPKGWN
jgi:hypothetical protein